VSKYDRLIFQDHQLHSMMKIYETKETQSLIWAFLNLKFLHFANKIEKVHARIVRKVKKQTFDLIHLFSIQIAGEPKEPMERREPVKTTIEVTKFVNFEPSKTELIEKSSTSTFATRESNNVIRVSTTESTPLVQRVHVPSSEIRVIYPSRINNGNQSNSQREILEKSTYEVKRQTSNSFMSPTKSSCETIKEHQSTRTVYPAKTISSSERIEYHRPLPASYTEHAVIRTEPTPIKSVIYRPAETQ
jgi:hypothetical protein